MIAPPSSISVDAVLERFEHELQPGQDADYFRMHRLRYRKTLTTISHLLPATGLVLDVGCHYMHQACMMRLLGYEVRAIDVPSFARLDLSVDRAISYGIQLAEVNDFSAETLAPSGYQCDAVLFCEILEHITFNPVVFWHNVRDVTKTNGFIYITTPNALAAMNLLNAARRLITLDGIGIDVKAIFQYVTYGHHWKEYSPRELVRYFAILSGGFEVKVHTYHYRPATTGQGFINKVRGLVRTLGHMIPALDDEIEAIVTVRNKEPFNISSPTYI